MKRHILFLAVIAVFAGFLRFYRLGEIPVGFHRDEAFLGYNAYSILKTGKDISSNVFPLHLESFLYSPAGYAYAAIPFLALFGLNEFAVRAPSAFFGTLTILPLFLLVAFLFQKHRHGRWIALAASSSFALSPWHINLSRVATEQVVALFFDLAGAYLFLLAAGRRSRKLFVASFIAFVISLYTYQASRSFVPLLVPLLTVAVFRQLSLKLRCAVIAGYFLAILLPLASILVAPTLATRIRTLLPSATPEAQLVIAEGNREDGVSEVSILTSRAFHNKVRTYTTQVVGNFFAHTTYDFLFTDRVFPDRYRVPGMGLLHLMELPFLVFGLIFLVRQRSAGQLIISAWLAIGIVGSALTFDDIPNLQRTLVALPAIAAIIGLGLVTFWETVRRFRRVAFLATLAGMAGYGYFVAYYLHQYYVHQLVHRPWYREEGFRELVPLVNSIRPNYRRILITDREPAPLVFFLFYTPYDPVQFQRETRGVSLVATPNIPFDGLTFIGEECPAISAEERRGGRKGTLYVNGPICKFPEEENLRILSTIARGDGTPVFQLTDAAPVSRLR